MGWWFGCYEYIFHFFALPPPSVLGSLFPSPKGADISSWYITLVLFLTVGSYSSRMIRTPENFDTKTIPRKRIALPRTSNLGKKAILKNNSPYSEPYLVHLSVITVSFDPMVNYRFDSTRTNTIKSYISKSSFSKQNSFCQLLI